MAPAELTAPRPRCVGMQVCLCWLLAVRQETVRDRLQHAKMRWQCSMPTHRCLAFGHLAAPRSVMMGVGDTQGKRRKPNIPHKAVPRRIRHPILPDLRAVVLPGSPLVHMHRWATCPAAVYANHRRLKSLQHVLQVDSHARPCLSVSGLSAVEQPSSYSRLRAERTGKTS